MTSHMKACDFRILRSNFPPKILRNFRRHFIYFSWTDFYNIGHFYNLQTKIFQTIITLSLLISPNHDNKAKKLTPINIHQPMQILDKKWLRVVCVKQLKSVWWKVRYEQQKEVKMRITVANTYCTFRTTFALVSYLTAMKSTHFRALTSAQIMCRYAKIHLPSVAKINQIL